MLFYIMGDHCEIVWVIRQMRSLDVVNGSNKFGDHCFKAYTLLSFFLYVLQSPNHCILFSFRFCKVLNQALF